MKDSVSGGSGGYSGGSGVDPTGGYGGYSGDSKGGFSSVSAGYSSNPWDEDCVLTIRKKDICRYVIREQYTLSRVQKFNFDCDSKILYWIYLHKFMLNEKF